MSYDSVAKTARCDWRKGCTNPVTHIGEKGYVYCEADAPNRSGTERVRKLLASERKALERGEALASFSRPKKSAPLKPKGHYYQGPGDDLCYKDAVFTPFATWADVLAHVRKKRVIWFQAAMESRPSACEAVAGPAEWHDPSRTPVMTRVPAGRVLMLPAPSTGVEPFLCDAPQLAQFSKRTKP